MYKLQKSFKALSDFNRVRILHLLAVRPLCVCEITAILQLATSTISQHLAQLRDAGLADSSKDGKWVDYRLPEHMDPDVESLLKITLRTDLDQAVIQRDRIRLNTVDRELICHS